MEQKDAALTAVEVDRGVDQVDLATNTDQIDAPDQFDDKYRTTRNEIWAYYACVVCGAGSALSLCPCG
jgi:cysteine synthase